MKPEFKKDRAEVYQLAFEIIYLPVGALPFLLCAKALDPLDHNPPVPTAVENGNLTDLGQAPPESPQVVMRGIIALGGSNWINNEPARVDLFGDPPDGAPLTRGVPSFKHHDHRSLLDVNLVCQTMQRDLIFNKRTLVFFRFKCKRYINGAQHYSAPVKLGSPALSINSPSILAASIVSSIPMSVAATGSGAKVS